MSGCVKCAEEYEHSTIIPLFTQAYSELYLHALIYVNRIVCAYLVVFCIVKFQSPQVDNSIAHNFA